MKTSFKRKFPYISVIVVLIVLIGFRIQYWSNNDENGYNAASWDAFGYYMYLPSTFIYHDYKELKWIDPINKKYTISGEEIYQISKVDEGETYTNKYLSGVAILETPYFLVGHLIAKCSSYEEDGFSTPYQYAILFGAILNVIFGLWILKRILIRYFSEVTVGFTLLFIGLTTNLIQYTSIDGAMSHSFIFPLYSLLIYFTIKWHEKPKWKSAIAIGLIIGLATISRPTEFIMVFIPLLWNTTTPEGRKHKWNLVKIYRWHILFAMIGGLIAISPQLIYWKHTTDSFLHNVGSKWYFLNPWFRVLVGPEKGWFLYTPIAILMVTGFFFMKNKDFKRSVLTFLILNIWIIISWSDWTYGASYSTRALVQSLPVFALPLATMIQLLTINKLRMGLTVGLLVALTVLNFYQMNIYNKGVLENFSPLLQ